ncbi:MAG: hypothetical protein IPO88_10760 [Nannocystis sp.]|uniref:hypothetical protein n=1 Tax=Nannocystis sp. TaxID=1962667 RepID=UPI0024280C56|nr:hypothetical protein [Nannocystis sp.]MBK9753969.1 hypothetical protein [Nannocystis sp.]
MIAATMRAPRAVWMWICAGAVALTLLLRIARGEVVVLSAHGAPVLRLVAIALVFLANCAEKLKPGEHKPGPSQQDEAAPGELSQGTASAQAGDLSQGTGSQAPPVDVAGLQEFPAALDDAAIEAALRWVSRRGLWRSFEAEVAGDARSVLPLADGAPPGEAAARLVAEVERHRERAVSGAAETVGSLTGLLDAAEAAQLYDGWLAGHLWRHARTLKPAPAQLFGRIERHLRVVQAIAAGEASTGPIEFSAWRSKAGPPPGWSGLRVPKGLAAAAREAFKQGVDAGTWESGATLALRVTQGEALLLRRGGQGRVAVGGWLRLRRLDVVRAPAGARLGHASLGELTLPAGAELTAWNAGEFLTATARTQLQARVDAALAGEAAALTELEGLLPLAHPAIRAAVGGRPEAPGAAGLRLLLTGFDE